MTRASAVEGMHSINPSSGEVGSTLHGHTTYHMIFTDPDGTSPSSDGYTCALHSMRPSSMDVGSSLHVSQVKWTSNGHKPLVKRLLS